MFRSKPLSRQRRLAGTNKPCVHQDPETHRDGARSVCECLLWITGQQWAATGRGLGCSRSGYGISPLGAGHH